MNNKVFIDSCETVDVTSICLYRQTKIFPCTGCLFFEKCFRIIHSNKQKVYVKITDIPGGMLNEN